MQPLPPPKKTLPEARDTESSGQRPSASVIPESRAVSSAPQGSLSVPQTAADGKRKRKHRGGKKKRNRRQSFAAPSEASTVPEIAEGDQDDPMRQIPGAITSAARETFYRRGQGRNLSDESLDSDVLLDHR